MHFQDSTIHSVLAGQSASIPDDIALESPGRYPVTYAGLYRLSQQVSISVRKAGLGKYGRAAIIMPNCPEFSVILLGVSSVAVSVPLNPDYSVDEYSRYFTELDVQLVILEAGSKSAARKVALDQSCLLLEFSVSTEPGKKRYGKRYCRLFSDQQLAPHEYKPTELSPFDYAAYDSIVGERPDATDAALILQTTGTTANSKVVALSHRNLLESAVNISKSLHLEPLDRCLSMLPQFHIGGLVDLLLAPIVSGGRTICTRGFDPEEFVICLRQYQPTWFQAVPTMLHELLSYVRQSDVETSGTPLRFIRSVSSALQPGLMEQLESAFKVPVVEIYGMTEAGPLIASNPLPPAPRKPGSVGIACGPELRVVDPQGAQVPVGEAGEVQIRGPGVFSGYENNEAANRGAFVGDWFRTGDLGLLDDDGYLFLNGRIRELINQGGEKISPFEIESVLLSHGSIEQAVCFPFRHESLGEAVAALVVPVAGELPSPESLREFLAKSLAAFKIPQKFVVADSVPRGATGKVIRRMLAEELGVYEEAEFISPRTNAEISIAGIWCELLELDTVGIRDDFHDLGGNSLIALRMTDGLTSRFGQAAADRMVSNFSTVESMARQVEQSQEHGSGDRSPTELGKSGSLADTQVQLIRTAITGCRHPAMHSGSFFLHLNRDGSRLPLIWCFNSPDREMKSLARELGDDQPLLGAYSGGGLFEFSSEVSKQTANFYADRILELEPAQPINLGGHCRGAAVTLDIAIELKNRGFDQIRVLLLEYFDPKIYLYDSNLTLCYGRKSFMQGHKLFNYGSIGWRERFVNPPEVVMLKGYHGSFWAKPFITGFADEVKRFLDTAVP